MPARDTNLGGIQKIVAGGARPGLIFRRNSFFSGGNPAKTPGRQSPAYVHLSLKVWINVCYIIFLYRLLFLYSAAKPWNWTWTYRYIATWKRKDHTTIYYFEIYNVD